MIALIAGGGIVITCIVYVGSTLIRQERAPFGASVVRVLYRSTGLHDQSIPVSGVVIIPQVAPEGPALFTGMIAKSYAPELNLIGVAAAAPSPDLATLLADDVDTNGGRNLTAMTRGRGRAFSGRQSNRPGTICVVRSEEIRRFS